MLLRKLLIGVIAASAALVLPACKCSSKAQRFTVEATATQDVIGSGNVEVDVIAVSESELARWSSISMDDYSSSQLRAGARQRLKTLHLSSESPTQQLSARDEIWDTWLEQGAQHIVLLTPTLRIPGASGEGSADPRRLILTLDRCRWTTSTLKAEVNRGGLRPLTVPKPVDAK